MHLIIQGRALGKICINLCIDLHHKLTCGIRATRMGKSVMRISLWIWSANSYRNTVHPTAPPRSICILFPESGTWCNNLTLVGFPVWGQPTKTTQSKTLFISSENVGSPTLCPPQCHAPDSSVNINATFDCSVAKVWICKEKNMEHLVKKF